jgi:hypothetical protein
LRRGKTRTSPQHRIKSYILHMVDLRISDDRALEVAGSTPGDLPCYRRAEAVYDRLVELLRNFSFNRLVPLPHWIRRRLRAVIWKHWKNRHTRVREILKRGVSRDFAVTTGYARKGPWRMSRVKWAQIALPDSYFESFGLVFPWM